MLFFVIFVKKTHMKKITILVLIASLLGSCGWFGKKNNEEKLSIAISPGQVGDFKIGDKINDIKLTNSQTMSSVEVPVGEGETEVRWFLKDNNLELLKFSEGESNTIREIEVLSPLYQTEKKIGTGSPLKKLTEAYEEITIWYTYITDRFIAETPQLSNIQFNIDPEAFIGDRISLYKTDMIELSADQFSPDAKILTIRVY
jgi:hypothetical protein